jgi:hypothetical protein
MRSAQAVFTEPAILWAEQIDCPEKEWTIAVVT